MEKSNMITPGILGDLIYEVFAPKMAESTSINTVGVGLRDAACDNRCIKVYSVDITVENERDLESPLIAQGIEEVSVMIAKNGLYTGLENIEGKPVIPFSTSVLSMSNNQACNTDRNKPHDRKQTFNPKRDIVGGIVTGVDGVAPGTIGMILREDKNEEDSNERYMLTVEHVLDHVGKEVFQANPSPYGNEIKIGKVDKIDTDTKCGRVLLHDNIYAKSAIYVDSNSPAIQVNSISDPLHETLVCKSGAETAITIGRVCRTNCTVKFRNKSIGKDQFIILNEEKPFKFSDFTDSGAPIVVADQSKKPTGELVGFLQGRIGCYAFGTMANAAVKNLELKL